MTAEDVENAQHLFCALQYAIVKCLWIIAMLPIIASGGATMWRWQLQFTIQSDVGSGVVAVVVALLLVCTKCAKAPTISASFVLIIDF